MPTRLYAVALVAFVLGLLITVQARVAGQPPGEILPAARVQELTAELRRLEEASAGLRREAGELEQKIAAAKQGQTQARAALQTEIEKYRIQAGLVPVVGPGVEVMIHNMPAGSLPGTEQYVFAVRDEDLLRVVNELWGAGAEAIAVNGQRLVSTSEIRLAGTFIDVNLQRITPPYTIVAIGDPDVLASALEIEGGVAEMLRAFGASCLIKKKDTVRIPAYEGTMAFQYARPIKEEVRG
ncbi:MAG: DUF881 domain-containing protein [Bacillota bacterium]